MKILITDDDSTSRLLLSAVLGELGHEVITAENGREAWAAFQTPSVHVVISDWMMPEMDGLELCRRIRAEHRLKYTYIILLTSLNGRGQYLEGMMVGADDFITKPFDEDELRIRLRVAARIIALQAEVKQLEGLLPICSYCKAIEESGEWMPVEQYVANRTDANFSHGICPICEVKARAELDQWRAQCAPR